MKIRLVFKRCATKLLKLIILFKDISPTILSYFVRREDIRQCIITRGKKTGLQSSVMVLSSGIKGLVPARAKVMADHVIRHARNGDIILLHDGAAIEIKPLRP